jgi:ribonuclease BN (tRNA processing enzyme)
MLQMPRRTLLALLLGLGALGTKLAALAQGAGTTQPDRMPALDGAIPPLQAPGTWLVILGSRGGPVVDPLRAQTASVVVVDGAAYLVDCGYGAVRQLVSANVGYQRIERVFLTHLHDDHIGDLAALLSYQWTGGKTTPTEVYGPYGTAHLVQAAIAYFNANVQIRTVDEGRVSDPTTLYHGHDVAASAAPVRVYQDERVTVTAVENAHYPTRSTERMLHRSIALRFDTPHRSIVFSGDTTYSPNLVALAKGADVFVCEIMDQSIREQMLARGRAAAAAGNAESIFRHIAETHSSPAEVARMASEAKVKTVVLNHLLPGLTRADGLAFPVSAFIDGVRNAGYAGEVIVSQDLMVL